MTRTFASIDLWCGMLCVGFGTAFAGIATSYDLGSAAAMGPGYFPMWLGGGLGALGASLIVKGCLDTTETISLPSLLPTAIVFGALVAFSVLLEPAGLLGAGLALVFLGSLAGAPIGPARLALFALGLVLFVTFVFVYLLGLAVPLWPRFGA